MHQNFSLSTNNNTNSNKENIPPINWYLMPSNTCQTTSPTPHSSSWTLNLSWPKWYNPNHLPESTPQDSVPPVTSTALIKRIRNGLKCWLPYVYDHIAGCWGLSNGYTYCCHKASLTDVPTPLISPKTDLTTIEAPIPHTMVQQLDTFYPDKASYLTFQTKVVHKPSFAAFDYAYLSHWSIKHQIKIAKELLALLWTMDKTHIIAMEAALIQMHKGPQGDGIFSKTTTIKEDRWEKTTTTYLHNAPPPKKRRSTYPQRKVSFLTPQETRLSSEFQQNPIIVEEPKTCVSNAVAPNTLSSITPLTNAGDVIGLPQGITNITVCNTQRTCLMSLRMEITTMITYLLMQTITNLENAESSINQ